MWSLSDLSVLTVDLCLLQKRFFASPLQEEVVTTEAQVRALIERGAAARQVGQTDYNARSSRSHSVFQVVRKNSRQTPPGTAALIAVPLLQTIESRDDAVHGSGVVRTSRLSLIDLAGSESATSQAERRAEGAFINRRCGPAMFASSKPS